MGRASLAVVDTAHIAAEITEAHLNALAAGRSALTYAKRAGELLIDAKEQVPHGEWLPWLSEHCPQVSEQQAQRYMRIARRWSEIEAVVSDPSRVTDLPVRQALALLAEPNPDRESPLPAAPDPNAEARWLVWEDDWRRRTGERPPERPQALLDEWRQDPLFWSVLKDVCAEPGGMAAFATTVHVVYVTGWAWMAYLRTGKVPPAPPTWHPDNEAQAREVRWELTLASRIGEYLNHVDRLGMLTRGKRCRVVWEKSPTPAAARSVLQERDPDYPVADLDDDFVVNVMRGYAVLPLLPPDFRFEAAQ
jgi:hypothetical protein